MPVSSMGVRAGLRDTTASQQLLRRIYNTSFCPWCLTRAEDFRIPRLQPRRHLSSSSRDSSAWSAAVSKIQSTVAEAIPGRLSKDNVTIDPLRIVAKELKFLSGNIRQLLGSGHPILDTVAKYYTQSEGKHVRPLLVLLM